LQAQGNLSLEDPAVKYIPKLNISSEITIEMLASQMSGLGRDRSLNPLPKDLDLTKYVSGYCGAHGIDCTPEQFLGNIGREPAVFAPETQPSCTYPLYTL